MSKNDANGADSQPGRSNPDKTDVRKLVPDLSDWNNGAGADFSAWVAFVPRLVDSVA